MINYYLLTKPGIIIGNLITVIAGFLLASKGHIDLLLLLATLIGLALIIASACVFNNYIDRYTDRQMKRTRYRALASGLISNQHAMIFATILGITGFLTLLLYTNLLTTLVAIAGFLIYVVLYSLWKGRTIYGTAIGSLAGATPPVIGYCAVSNQLDAGTLILFAMMVLWQMPHFFAIAIYHFDDYVKSQIPILPIQKGMWRTKIHMVLYILSFILMATLLTFFNYTGYLYFIVTTSVSLLWLWLGMQGFKSDNDQRWGRQMFRISLIVIAATCLIIPLDIV